MVDKTFEELHEEFLKIARQGDEAALKKFLIAHLKEFPQKMQEEIIMSFVEDATTRRKENLEELAEFRKEGLAAAAAIEKSKKALEDRAALLDLKEQL